MSPKLLNDLVMCLEFFHDMNINIKIILPILSPDRFILCVSHSGPSQSLHREGTRKGYLSPGQEEYRVVTQVVSLSR